MKNLFKKFPVVIVAIMLAACSLVQAGAVTVYKYNGYIYTRSLNDELELYGWEGGEKLVVPAEINDNKLVSVDEYSIRNHKEITILDFSNAVNLKTIEAFAFEGCSNISNEIVIPASVTDVEISAFQGCSSVPGMTIDGPITRVPNQMFAYCTSLKYVNLPDTVSAIGDFAFYNCSSLAEITIPDSVTSINRTAFLGCNDVTLVCKYDSYAHKFAVENNLKYIFNDNYAVGDVNFDGNVNIKDATLIQRTLASIDSMNELQCQLADFNADGKITITDITAIQKSLADISF